MSMIKSHSKQGNNKAVSHIVGVMIIVAIVFILPAFVGIVILNSLNISHIFIIAVVYGFFWIILRKIKKLRRKE